MRRFTEADVQRLLPMEEAVAALRGTFRALGTGEASNQPRRRLTLPTGTVLHSMAGACAGLVGTKVYASHPRHGAWFTLLVFEAVTGRPVAEFEANYLGQIRTGAASGLATDLLATRSASVLASIGSGFQARSQVEAVLSVRPIQTVQVWSRQEEKRLAFARWCEERLGVRAVASASAREAVEGADVLCTSTHAREPVVASEHVPDGCHVNAVGANWADRRELPAGLLERAERIVVDSREQAELEAGDLLLARPVAEWSRWPIQELAALCVDGGVPTRDGLTIFKSVGLGVEDVAMAAHILAKAT